MLVILQTLTKLTNTFMVFHVCKERAIAMNCSMASRHRS